MYDACMKCAVFVFYYRLTKNTGRVIRSNQQNNRIQKKVLTVSSSGGGARRQIKGLVLALDACPPGVHVEELYGI